MIMKNSPRVRSCSLYHRPLCGFWLDILPQIRTCSLRRRGIYDFGREHESGAKSLSQNPQTGATSGLEVANLFQQIRCWPTFDGGRPADKIGAMPEQREDPAVPIRATLKATVDSPSSCSARVQCG